MSSRTPRILYPERSIQLAKTAAMNSLLRLMKINADILPEIYHSSRALWEEARAEREGLSCERDPDRFVPICDVEKHLRKNFLALVFNTTALYGNRETKRVYSWREGTIGPLNVLLNMAGAQLRFLAMTRYPFPMPAMKNVRRINKSGKKYFQRSHVYGGTDQRPTVIITHPMLPSLDFVDAIRGHLVELCRQCFIHAVPVADASMYISLLIFRLRPLLDIFYLAGFDRRKRTVGFTKRSLTILNTVVEMVKGQHGITIGYPSRLTSGIEDIDYSSLGTNELLDQIDDSEIKQILKEKQEVERLVGNEDIVQLVGRITTTVIRVGTRLHRRMAWGMAQPFSSMSAILGGDYLARDRTGYLLATEVPVNAGRGKVDYTLFVRKVPEYMEEETDSTIGLWAPRLVLDLKTKSAFDWGVRTESHDKTNSKVISFPLKRRSLTDTEWETAINNTPGPSEQKQVVSYADVLLQEYKTLAKDDLKPPDSNLRGIILVDGNDFPSRIRRIMPKFINAVFEQIRNDILELRVKDQDGRIEFPRTLFEPAFRWSLKTRVAIVILPFTIPQSVSVQDILPLPSPQQALHRLNPFEKREEDHGHFILYLVGDDVGSPGDSAGWIAQHWHGLQFAYDSAKKHECKKVVWIDLAGHFSSDLIRTTMLRLDFHHERIRQFYDNIEFLDLSAEIERALFSGEELPSVQAIQARIKDYDLVIVSGIDSIRQIVPDELEGLSDTLTVHIADAAARPDTCTLWFGMPSPLATCSKLYKRQQLRPFNHNSPLQPYIDEIVINIPLPPIRGGSRVPKHDYVRGLVSLRSDMANGFNCTTIGISPLIGWSRRFLSRRHSAEEQDLLVKIQTRPPSTSRWLKALRTPTFNEDMAVDLFPFLISWYQRAAGIQTKGQPIDRNLESLNVMKRTLERREGTGRYRGVFSRLTFSRAMCTPSPEGVNIRRRYRTTWLELKPLQSVALPPHSSELLYTGLSISGAGKIELARLQETSLFLLGLDTASSPLKEQCLELVKILSRPERVSYADILRSISEVFKGSRYLRQIWYRLLWDRNWLEGWPLPVGMQEDIAKLQVENKDILQDYGNYLVFMIASLAEHYTLHQTELQALWHMVRPWVLMQLGARPRTENQPLSMFDTQGVYEQLRARAQYWNSTPATTALSNIRYGLCIDVFKSHRWYIFEDGAYSNRYITGCIEHDGEKSGPLSLVRASAITSLTELCALTDFTFSDCRIRPLLIADHQGIDVLYEGDRQFYEKRELDDLARLDSINWYPVGMIRYGTRSRYSLARLRYIKVLTLGMQYPSIHNQRLPVRQTNFGQQLFEYVKSIGTLTEGVIGVKCSLEGSMDKGSISLRVYDKERWRTVGQRINFQGIDQAAQVLLLPYTVGTAVQGKYTWDPLTDVHWGFGREDLKKVVTSIILLDREEET